MSTGAVASRDGRTRALTAHPPPGPSGDGLLTDTIVDAALDEVRTTPDDELLGRARELLARTQRERPARQCTGVSATDVLLAEARRRDHPRLLGQLLRYAAAIRLVTHTPLVHADPLLDELAVHADRHEMPILLADAYALRARRSVLAGTEEAALTDAATALSMLSEPDPAEGPAATSVTAPEPRLLATALTDLGLVLTQLGAHELADEVFERSARHLSERGAPMESLVNALNRLRLLLSWALRLERAGHLAEADERFATAEGVGRLVEPLWRRTMFQSGDREPAEQCAVLGAALALADPGPQHVRRLQDLAAIANFTSDRIVVAIGLGRSLERSGRLPDAMAMMASFRHRLSDGESRSEPMLQLALSRELARLQEELTPTRPGSDPIRAYASALEAEMWALRQSRIAALRSQSDHLRLARAHGAVAAAAMSDPLTGLPNRRSLDEVLHRALNPAEDRPCAVALIDIDGFKEVNDQHSHAAGDEVLRVVAETVRQSLRAGDTVARYGGDEFVVVLPATTLRAAGAALRRAVRAVAALPPDAGAGVTLSAGVVAGTPEGAAQVAAPRSLLAGADAAMYRAKRLGGNRVVTADESGPTGSGGAAGTGGGRPPVADP